jgi:hypothetical protein
MQRRKRQASAATNDQLDDFALKNPIFHKGVLKLGVLAPFRFRLCFTRDRDEPGVPQ